MGKIYILDDHIANQIAAGEVVERPASVVKELIENSIDAGSTKIQIEIEEGGLNIIRIRDNGEGIDEDDIEKAFYRHATSKLIRSSDLFRIKTLGFRGEALPSIAAVSKLTIKTSSNIEGHGIELSLEGGTVTSKSKISFNKGTEITVKDLFFNTPARLKYMKSLQTEIGRITDYVNRLSLAYPQIAFSLLHNEHLIIRTNGDHQLLHVLGAIYGTALAKNMLPFGNENTDFKITGYLSKPEITRANKNHISIFVNGRYIKNYALTQAIIDGYKTLLMLHRYPIATLYIELDHSLIDVNVHPAKLEVRFSKEQELLKFIETTIFQSLHQETFIREPLKEKSNKAIIHQEIQDTFDYSYKPVDSVQQRKLISTTFNSSDIIEKEKIKESKNLNNTMEYSIPSGGTSNRDSQQDRLPFLEPITQYLGTYIIAQNQNGLYLIDQHAAHERINYEKNIQRINEENSSSQELLVPININFTNTEVDTLLRGKDYLLNFGVDVDPFGLQTIRIRSIPVWIPKGQEQEYIGKIIQMFLNKGEIQLQELRQHLVADASCKASIKANQYMTKYEMEQLLEQLRKTENPFSCPHGRPIIIHFSIYEIEKMFKRVI